LQGFRFVILFACVALVSLNPAASAAQGGTVLRPDPLEQTIGVGQVETVSIVVENIEELYGGEVHLQFDPDVVEVVDADEGKAGVQITPGDFPKAEFVAVNKADNTAGTIDYALTQLNPTPPANGSGVFLSIQFRGKALGESSPLTSSKNVLAVVVGPQRVAPAPFEWQDGTLTVVQPKPPTPTLAAPVTETSPPDGTIAATATPRRTRTPAPIQGPSGASTDLLVSGLLVVIAGGGCIGALAILGVAAFVLLRRPRRPQPPPGHWPPRGSQQDLPGQ
jgi:hypothetical protein